MRVRRVVTGVDDRGRSVFVSDGYLEAKSARVMPGYELTTAWGDDAVPNLPTSGSEPDATAYFPPPGGFRFVFSTIPAEGSEPAPQVEPAEGMAELELLFPGITGHLEDPEPGWHTSDTVDIQLILHGQLICELDDGAKVTLGAGDFLIQNGTRHRWINPGPGPTQVFTALMGAQRDRVR